MSKTTAYIEVTYHEFYPFTDRRYCTFRWVGNKRGIARIGARYFETEKLPFRLKVIDHDFQSDTYEVALANDWYWIVYVLQNRFIRMWKFVFVRFILTLNVWGLAYTPIGNEPSIKDIGKKAKF